MYLSLDEAAKLFMDPNRIKSNAEIVALLSPEDRAIILEGVDMEEYQYDWSQWARPKQIIPDDPYYNIHLLLSGRGGGKTRTMAEWVRAKAVSLGGTRIALMGRTNGETRDILVTGESGLLSIPQKDAEKPVYKPSEGKVIWPNGSEAKILSAETPDAVRGNQYHYSVVDEFAAHTPWVGSDGLTAFQNLRIATRLGEYPMMVVATTPKRVKALRNLLDESKDPTNSIRVVHGKTSENASNLSAAYLSVIQGTYAGTALARQELDGEMLDEDPEGALWTDEMIQAALVHELHDSVGATELTTEIARAFPYRIVGVDPTVAANPHDECGIIVAGSTTHRSLHLRKAMVLEDVSLKASPEVWAQSAVDAALRWRALGVVVEGNQGGDLLRMTIHAINPNIKVFVISASASKAIRAEPVQQVYQQGRVKHLSQFVTLQEQQTSWEPNITKKSPDRIDALVHAVTSLLFKPPRGMIRRPIRASVSDGTFASKMGHGLVRQAVKSSRTS